jgi:NosR/NirI family transcriptional regulator, nitrous oxide reductase regulator
MTFRPALSRAALLPALTACVPSCIPWLAMTVIAALALMFALAPALAEKGKLRERLTPEVMAVVFPGAEKLGPEEGTPPAIPAYKDGKIAAYIFSTLDIVAAPGYSTTPFDVIAGVDTSGRITGAKVIFHVEPYIYHDAVRQPLLDTFLARQAGTLLQGGAATLQPDFVKGASISARAMRAAILDSGRLVARSRISRPVVSVPTLDLDGFRLMSWKDLMAAGAVAQRRITSGEVATALAAAGASGAALDVPLGKPDEPYIELFAGLLTPAAVGGNLLGLRNFEEYRARLPHGAPAIFIASNGPYDFIGTKHFRQSEGNRFDRIRVVQGDETFSFTNDNYQRLGTGSADGIRAQQYAGLFALPANAKFDPLRPWRLELLVNGSEPSAGTDPRPVSVAMPVEFRLGPAFVLMPEEPPVPAWVEAWHDARWNIAILAVLLAVVTGVFVFQAPLSRSRRVHRVVRNAVLLFVLVWLGWTVSVQLSIVNVINYLEAPFRGFNATFYLAEPLMVIIAAYTLISVVLIGRGVFCGWLCPFGALQELLAQVSRALGLPQWNPSEALEKRLWLGKYIAAAVVLGLVLTSIDTSGATTEIEPFKTAITSKFTRAWPYVLYAGILLAIGLFSERAYCRFLCPLGGVLAVLDRLHLIDLLKRRPECGNPCRLCERACPVRAIERSGKIITAECFQCLDCQVEYYDDKRCPPLVQAAKRRGSIDVETVPVAAMVKHV